MPNVSCWIHLIFHPDTVKFTVPNEDIFHRMAPPRWIDGGRGVRHLRRERLSPQYWALMMPSQHIAAAYNIMQTLTDHYSPFIARIYGDVDSIDIINSSTQDEHTTC